MKTKEELALQVGMQFDEVAELFSEETLNSMLMMHVVGGAGDTVNNCGKKCAGCNCPTYNCSDGCSATTTAQPTTVAPQ